MTWLGEIEAWQNAGFAAGPLIALVVGLLATGGLRLRGRRGDLWELLLFWLAFLGVFMFVAQVPDTWPVVRSKFGRPST